MYKYYETSFKNQSLSLKEKFFNLSFSYILFIVILASIGIVVLYSAANGSWRPWAINQLIRFVLGFGVMMVFAMTDIRFFMKIAYPFYFVSLLLLIYVEVRGSIGMGAQRWIDLKFFSLQPSELMKIALVLVLAKYFHSSSLQNIESMRGLVVPILLTLFPAFLVMTQPDLGTALMLIMSAGAIFFVVGVQIWKFVVVMLGGAVLIPFAWHFLHDYQKNRVLTFLDPERDPLGAGYHIIQSKIALGSGGVFGKGHADGSLGDPEVWQEARACVYQYLKYYLYRDDLSDRGKYRSGAAVGFEDDGVPDEPAAAGIADREEVFPGAECPGRQ